MDEIKKIYYIGVLVVFLIIYVIFGVFNKMNILKIWSLGYMSRYLVVK